MTDTPPPTPLTDQALSRLRKLAEGNGLAPDKIELTETQEKVYVLNGLTKLTPFCERHEGHYPGPPRGNDRVIVADVPTLNAEVLRRQREFQESSDWLPAAMAELKAAPAEGWGLDGAKITLREKSAALAALEICSSCQGHKMLTCEQCQGQGVVTCPQCQGRGQEPCYVCAGTGQNPARAGQPCTLCNGRRSVPCRSCRASGKIACPVCQGRRGIVCPQCRGTGGNTEEIILVCGATVNFSMKGDELPSGLRRGLDRLGIANLAKGHADISLIAAENEKKEGAPPRDAAGKPEVSPIVRYEAKLPYADLKLRFSGGRVVLAGVFGKRGLLMGVPAFLDEALRPWRDRLKQAAAGAGSLDNALKARAMRDALALELNGQGRPENLRRLYPAGLSLAAMQEILLDMRRALDRFTRVLRAGVGFGIGAVGAGLLAVFLFMPLHAQLASNAAAGLLLDLMAPALVMGLGWIALGKASQLALARRFPGLKISPHRHAGNIGYAMLTGIFIAWIFLLLLAPNKPGWLSYLFALLNHKS